MGAVVARRNLKEEYLKVVEKQKMIYAKTHPEVYLASRLMDWRVEVFRDLKDAEKKVPWAFWPAAITEMLERWDIMMDEKWKSNLLWHDYLCSYQQRRPFVPVSTRSTLQIPLPSASGSPSVHSLSLLDFLKRNLRADKTHAIAAMIATFTKEFYLFYSGNPDLNDSFELDIDVRDLKDVNKVVSEIQLFVELCLRAFGVYYKGVDFPQLMTEPLIEIRELIVERVFTRQVGDVLMTVYTFLDQEKAVTARNNADKYAGLTCEELGINAFFCVDKEKPQGGKGNGFEKAIEGIKRLDTAFTPKKKLTVVVRSAQLICECVDDFWEDTPDIERGQLLIASDQILNIYLYLVLKARIPRLSAHLRLMQDFLRKDILQSSLGFYISTLEASLENVSMLSTDFLERLRTTTE